MTDLNKRVVRRTRSPCPVTRRRWVVALAPGDVLVCREEGRRKTYSAPLAKVCVQVAKWNAEAEKTTRRTRKVPRGYTWR